MNSVRNRISEQREQLFSFGPVFYAESSQHDLSVMERDARVESSREIVLGLRYTWSPPNRGAAAPLPARL